MAIGHEQLMKDLTTARHLGFFDMRVKLGNPQVPGAELAKLRRACASRNLGMLREDIAEAHSENYKRMRQGMVEDLFRQYPDLEGRP